MPSAITGPLAIGPPASKTKSGRPLSRSRALKAPRFSPAKTRPFTIPTGESELAASGASHLRLPVNASSAVSNPGPLKVVPKIAPAAKPVEPSKPPAALATDVVVFHTSCPAPGPRPAVTA